MQLLLLSLSLLFLMLFTGKLVMVVYKSAECNPAGFRFVSRSMSGGKLSTHNDDDEDHNNNDSYVWCGASSIISQ